MCVCVQPIKQAMLKSFEVTELPVRSAKFIPSKQWIIAGADDMLIRVYNYNTMDKVSCAHEAIGRLTTTRSL